MVERNDDFTDKSGVPLTDDNVAGEIVAAGEPRYELHDGKLVQVQQVAKRTPKAAPFMVQHQETATEYHTRMEALNKEEEKGLLAREGEITTQVTQTASRAAAKAKVEKAKAALKALDAKASNGRTADAEAKFAADRAALQVKVEQAEAELNAQDAEVPETMAPETSAAKAKVAKAEAELKALEEKAPYLQTAEGQATQAASRAEAKAKVEKAKAELKALEEKAFETRTVPSSTGVITENL
jgi:hypothetical protein